MNRLYNISRREKKQLSSLSRKHKKILKEALGKKQVSIDEVCAAPFMTITFGPKINKNPLKVVANNISRATETFLVQLSGRPVAVDGW